MNETLWIGFYSETAAEQHGTAFWEDDKGQTHEVTGVYTKETAADYGWKDKVVVSERLVKWVGGGKRGTVEKNRLRTIY